jgi:8-amino-7-oxononanoate synthase
MHFSEGLKILKRKGLLRTVRDRSSPQGSRIRIGDKEFINFGSNDYLGLANHPEIIEAAKRAMDEFGFGGGAARLLAGGTLVNRRLEEFVARFKGTEAAVTLNSGYAANMGIIPSIAEDGDLLFSDALNHASIIDGCRLSSARIFIYRHRDVEHLDSLMSESLCTSGTKGRSIVVTDTVFSMDGDIAPLPDLCELCRRKGAYLFLDDAHGTGVLGKGKGALAHFGISPEEWIIQMGTFSKAIGSFGAFAAGRRDVIEWITNTARGFIFSSALPTPVIAASLKAMSLIEEKPALVQRLWENHDLLVRVLMEDRFVTESETPVIPLKTKSVEDALMASDFLFEKGIYVPAIRPPAVREPRLRVTVTAAHSNEDVDSLIEALCKIKTFFCCNKTRDL